MTKPKDFWVRHEFGADRLSIEETKTLERLSVVVVLDNIRSAHNVGSIFRTADGARLGELYLCGYTPVPPHRHLSKTALGAVETVPWQQFDDVKSAIENLRERDAMIIALEKTDDSRCLYEYSLPPCSPQKPLALIVGNEAEGLSGEVLSLCDAVVHLPMRGHKNSLNVSVAFGIAAYEVVRRLVGCEE
jgi:23S rRNA (guanosine2251-2'-O)-methyltransferase